MSDRSGRYKKVKRLTAYKILAESVDAAVNTCSYT